MHTERLSTLRAGSVRGTILVPVGQLEQWFPEVGGHGTKWVTDALAGGLHTRPETPVWEFVASLAGAST